MGYIFRTEHFSFLKSKALYPNSSHALRGNSSGDALRPVTQSVTGGIPTLSVGMMSTPGFYGEIGEF